MIVEVNEELIPWHKVHNPIITDKEWIESHAFWFNESNMELSPKHKYAEAIQGA